MIKLKMDLVQFIENRYQELTLQSKEQKTFDAMGDCEQKALHQLLNSYRMTLKWLLIPKCLYEFAAVNLGKRPAPEPVLTNLAKAQREKAQQAKESLEQEKTSLHAVPTEQSPA